MRWNVTRALFIKPVFSILALLCTLGLPALQQAKAQCTGPSGTISVGPTGTYTTLTAAIAATSTISGSLILELQSTYSSSGETFPLTFPVNTCVTATRTITVRPATGATALSIVSSNTTATIDLNGATYVTIDGRPGGTGTTSQLTISNTATGSPSAVRFINDASNNAVRYCTILGSASTSLGVVSFAGGIITGNDNNTISNNNVGPAGANQPLNGIYSLGTGSAIDNSGNSITSNNIADVFSAGSSYAAINVNTGNSGWTITGNKVYLTAAGSVTTASINYGIFIGAGTGYTISNNVIGYSSSSATGTMTMNSTVGLRYTAINGGFTVGSPASTIQGNMVAGIAMTTGVATTTTNGNLCGINITSGDVNVTGNTIGATTGTSSLSINPGVTSTLLVGIHSSSAGTISIQNNILGSWNNSSTTSTIGGSIMGVNVSVNTASITISGNIIGNTTADNISAGINGTTTVIAQVSGINLPSTAAGTITVSNNTIRNLSAYGTGSSFIRGIWTAAASGGTSVNLFSGNTISNLTTNSALTTITSGQVGACGINLSVGNNSILSQNTIFNISNINTASTGSFVAGITMANGTNSTASRNIIYGISNAGTSTTTTAPSIAAGIIIRSGTTAATVANNMISLGNGQTTNTAFIGIQCNHGSTPDPTNNIYYNSINIEGTVGSGAQPSFGIARTDFTATARTAPMVVRNNVVVNTRNGGTGKHYAIANNYGATAIATGWGTGASNFNVLNAAAANVGYWSGDLSFSGWQTSSSGDANSASGVTVPFVNTATGDLHINSGTTATRLESGGTAIPGFANDYDNQVRPGPSGSLNGGACAPDLGADEFDGVPLDVTGPIINYTALTNTSCISPATRLLSGVTMIECSGINVATGTKPRLYYKKSADANTYAGNTSADNGWKFVEASNSAAPFSFTIDYSKLQSAVAGGDVIQYFVVAQDLVSTPNVGIGSGTFTTTPASVALTSAAFPIGGTINSYTIISSSLAGPVTIGATGTYTSLTGASGLFNAINTNGLTGNVTATIIDASITEGGTIALNTIINTGCAAGAYTLSVKPQASPAVATTLTGNSANPLIKLNGADGVTIDGLNAGGASLKIINTNTGGSVFWIASVSATDGASNDTIRNCTIACGATATAIAGIIAGSGSALGGAGDAPNNNNTIQGNVFTATQNGIYINGFATTLDQGWLIDGNTFGSASVVADKLGFRGLSVQWVNNFTISNNIINGVFTAATSTGTATGISTFNTATNGNIFNNKISDIKSTNTGGFGSNGIALSGTSNTSGINVYNNFISDVASAGFSGMAIGDNGYGIVLASGGGYNIYDNTVLMNTDQTATTGNPAAINITSGIVTAGSLTIRNNIFANIQTIGTNRFAIISNAPATVFADINYNDYYSAASSFGYFGANISSIAAWRTATGFDLQSLNVAPVFTSTTAPADLHLSNAVGANWCLNGAGAAIAGITTDIDGQGRTTPPDMGADEFTPTDNTTGPPTSQVACSGTAITTIALAGTASSFSWTRDNTATVIGIAASGTGSISGTLTNTTTSPVTVTFTITPLNANGCPFGTNITRTVIVNPTPNASATPASQTLCTGTAITAVLNTGTITGTVYNWVRDNTVSVTGLTNSGSGTISGTPVNATAAPVTVTFTVTPSYTNAGTTCTGTAATATATVNPVNTATLSSAAGTNSQTVCTNSAITAITYTTTGATGATFSGLPAGLTGSWAANVVTVSGTPTASGSFSYTVTLTGGCGAVTATGTMTVTPVNTATLSSAAGTNAQTVCTNTPLTNITYATTGATGAGFSGLPAGVSGTWAGNVATISGTPTVSGTFNYTVTLTGGCGTVTATGSIASLSANTIALSSAASTASQTVCVNSAISNITYNTTLATGAGFSGLPAGVTGSWAANVVTISGTPTVSGSFSYTVTLTGGCGTTTAAGAITVINANTITLSSATGTNAQTVCINNPAANITYTTTGATGATVSGLPAGVSGSWASNVVTITGTPTASGSFTYTVTLTGGCGATLTATGSITVTPNNTATLSSAAGSNAQAICMGAPLGSLTYATTGATGATVTGLPAGISGAWAGNVVTISGTPSVSGSFNYTVTLTGGCGATTATGSITVSPNNSVTLTSGAGSNIQALCVSTPATNITYTTTGATGATFSGLPAGVSGNWTAGTITISGTPTASGTFNYTATLTGGAGCGGAVTATGTLTVSPSNTVALTSAAGSNAQTKCINTALTNITYATTGATGATFSGLPAGVNGSWGANVATISGTPTASGTFNYTVTLTGGCAIISATGTITVTPGNTVTLTSATGSNAQTVCVSTPATTITYATTGATGATVSGLPAGVSGVWAGNVITISGTPTATGTFNYTATLTGGCGTVTATGTMVVSPNNTIALSSAPATAAQTKCLNTAISNITYATTGATGATVTGLPAGVTGIWAGNVVTISGTPTASGTFTYTVTPGGGCGTATAAGTITVNPLPNISISPLAPVTICAGANVVLTASGANTYSWSPGATLSSTSGSSVTATPTGNTTYLVTGTDLNGCISSATRLVTVNALPNIAITPAGPVSFCGGLSATLTASGGSTYSWSPAAGLNLTTSASVVASPAGTTLYTVTGTGANGCTNTATKTVTIIPAPNSGITPADYINICQDDSVHFTAAAGYANYVWMLYGVPVKTGVNAFSTTTGGFYTLKVTDVNGCSSTTATPSVITVTQRPSPVVTRNGGTLDAGAGYSTYQWYQPGVYIAGATSQMYTPTANGTYYVAVTDTTGLHCSGNSGLFVFRSLGVGGSTIADAIKLYPNPANDLIHIDAPVSVNITVSSMDGKQILSAMGVHEINVGAFADGVYRILITDKAGNYLKMEKITKVTR